MLNDGYGSLDQILGDPDLARKFDEIASSLAPGFTSLEYRWAALKLRKEAKFARSRSELKKVPAQLKKCVLVADIDWTRVPESGGVYRVTGERSGKIVDLYVGETLNLRDRLRRQFREAAPLRAWQGRTSATDFYLATSVIEGGIPELLSYESRLIRRYNPLLNLKELGKELRRSMKDLLVAALEVTCQGFSADRVVADPALNAAFLHACAQRGLRGSPTELNRMLLNLRNADCCRAGSRGGRRLPMKATIGSQQKWLCVFWSGEMESVSMKSSVTPNGHPSLMTWRPESRRATRVCGIVGRLSMSQVQPSQTGITRQGRSSGRRSFLPSR